VARKQAASTLVASILTVGDTWLHSSSVCTAELRVLTFSGSRNSSLKLLRLVGAASTLVASILTVGDTWLHSSSVCTAELRVLTFSGSRNSSLKLLRLVGAASTLVASILTVGDTWLHSSSVCTAELRVLTFSGSRNSSLKLLRLVGASPSVRVESASIPPDSSEFMGSTIIENHVHSVLAWVNVNPSILVGLTLINPSLRNRG